MKLSNLYKEISEELGLPINEVKFVMNHLFGEIAGEMRRRTSEDVLLHGLGTLYINPKRYDHILKTLLRGKKKGRVSTARFNREFPVMWEQRRKLRKKHGIGQ